MFMHLWHQIGNLGNKIISDLSSYFSDKREADHVNFASGKVIIATSCKPSILHIGLFTLTGI